MCNFYFLRYVCGHYEPYYFPPALKSNFKSCGRPGRTCKLGREFAIRDEDCADCVRQEKRRVRAEKNKMQAMSKEDFMSYGLSESLERSMREPLPSIVVSRVPSVDYDSVALHKKMLVPPRSCYTSKQRDAQRIAWGAKMFVVAGQVKEISAILSPSIETLVADEPRPGTPMTKPTLPSDSGVEVAARASSLLHKRRRESERLQWKDRVHARLKTRFDRLQKLVNKTSSSERKRRKTA